MRRTHALVPAHSHIHTHTHSHPCLCQVNRVISEGQDMERWKVTPPDTDSAPSSLLCIDKRVRQRAGRHTADKSSALDQYHPNTLSSLGLMSGRNPIQFLTSSSRCQHLFVQTLTFFLSLFHWKPHRRNEILLICCCSKHKLLKSENILSPVKGPTSTWAQEELSPFPVCNMIWPSCK